MIIFATQKYVIATREKATSVSSHCTEIKGSIFIIKPIVPIRYKYVRFFLREKKYEAQRNTAGITSKTLY